MRIPIRKPRLPRTVSLNSLRRLIRFQGWVLGRPNPNDRQNIRTRQARLTRATSLPILARVNRLPGKTRLTRMTSITSSTRKTILTRLAVMDRRTRLNRLVSLTRRRIFIRG